MKVIKGSSLKDLKARFTQELFSGRILKPGVRAGLAETVFLPNFIMSASHLGFPAFLFGFPLVLLPLHPVLEVGGSAVLTLAAAEQAEEEGDDEGARHHRDRDDQDLEVH